MLKLMSSADYQLISSSPYGGKRKILPKVGGDNFASTVFTGSLLELPSTDFDFSL